MFNANFSSFDFYEIFLKKFNENNINKLNEQRDK